MAVIASTSTHMFKKYDHFPPTEQLLSDSHYRSGSGQYSLPAHGTVR